MIIDLTRKTTRETHNPVRRMRLKKLHESLAHTSWGACKEINVKIKQGDTLALWRG